MFRSYLLLAVTMVWVAAPLWWVAEEEKQLASARGFGDDYHAYTKRTGRFLPRVRHGGG